MNMKRKVVLSKEKYGIYFVEVYKLVDCDKEGEFII